MGVTRKWIKIVQRKLSRSSSYKDTLFPRANTCLDGSNPSESVVLVEDREADIEDLNNSARISSPVPTFPERVWSEQEKATIKIQTCFRGHLARRAYRTLRSLVKVQALVRGVLVRRQAHIALHCMHSLVRIQVRIRARQLLGGYSDG